MSAQQSNYELLYLQKLLNKLADVNGIFRPINDRRLTAGPSLGRIPPERPIFQLSTLAPVLNR